jgi:hypothetical protein
MLRHLVTVSLVTFLAVVCSASNKNIHYEGAKMAADNMTWITAEVTPRFMEGVEFLVGMLKDAKIITCPDSQFYIHGLKEIRQGNWGNGVEVEDPLPHEYKFIFPIREPCRNVKAQCEIQMKHSRDHLHVTKLDCENIHWEKSTLVDSTTAVPEITGEPTWEPTGEPTWEPTGEPTGEPTYTTQGIEATTDDMMPTFPAPAPELSSEIFIEEPMLFHGNHRNNAGRGGHGFQGMFHYDAKVGKMGDVKVA